MDPGNPEGRANGAKKGARDPEEKRKPAADKKTRESKKRGDGAADKKTRDSKKRGDGASSKTDARDPGEASDVVSSTRMIRGPLPVTATSVRPSAFESIRTVPVTLGPNFVHVHAVTEGGFRLPTRPAPRFATFATNIPNTRMVHLGPRPMPPMSVASGMSLVLLRLRALDSPADINRFIYNCQDWFNLQIVIPGRETRVVAQELVNKIFQDSFGEFCVFLIDGTLLPTTSLPYSWKTHGPYGPLGLTFRHPLLLQGTRKPWALYIFDHQRTPVRFTFDDLAPKFRQQQLEIDAFGHSRGEHGFGTEMMVLPRGFRYPKEYIFHSIHDAVDAV